ncbi:hypothetical protein FB451DRAFT_1209869 [Mycena latifolia]|nr:hypothetical protein FB451DRAFT_1209869 [Mycena latifolia]
MYDARTSGHSAPAVTRLSPHSEPGSVWFVAFSSFQAPVIPPDLRVARHDIRPSNFPSSVFLNLCHRDGFPQRDGSRRKDVCGCVAFIATVAMVCSLVCFFCSATPFFVLAGCQLSMSSFLWLFLATTLFLTECLGLSVPSVSESCTTDACRPAQRSVDRRPIRDSAHPEALRLRSLNLDTYQIIVIVAAVVGAMAVCGILAIVLWYRRGSSSFVSKKEEGFADLDDDKVPLSAPYIAPPPRVYAERWASLVGSTSRSAAQPSATRWPNLVISIPADEPPPARSWKLKRIPVPRLSSLASAGPRTPLARMRLALRTPRTQQDFQGSRSLSLRPKPPPSPLAIFLKEDSDRRLPSPGIVSGVPSALPSAPPMTSRLAALMYRTKSEYKV